LSIEAEASATDYEASIADEISLLIALGPELSLPSGAISLQAIGYKRSYGGETSGEGLGLRLRYQERLSDAGRIFLYADGRTTSSEHNELDGYTASGLVAYEHTFSSRISMSGTLVVRREWLDSNLASNTEYAAYYAFGALLPLGLRGGGSLGAAYLAFDATNAKLSDHPRSDWRVNAGAYLTTQKAPLLGLWPTLGYTYITTASSIPLFDAERHRVRFNLAKRF
jgi:hypothetical protein